MKIFYAEMRSDLFGSDPFWLGWLEPIYIKGVSMN